MRKGCFASMILLSLAGVMLAFRVGKDRKIRNPDSCGTEASSINNDPVVLDTNESLPGVVSFPSAVQTNKSFSFSELERLGRVPMGANERTWRLCEKTSWWGRRLDASSFWSNRVIWLSSEAESEAHAHGRGYPPIPPGDPLFWDRSDSDESNPVLTWEYHGRSYHSSERENAYWDWFQKNRPRPPEAIDRALRNASDEWMSIKHETTIRPHGLKIPPSSKEGSRSRLAARYVALGFPRNAFSSTVLDWEYIRCKRAEREEIVSDSDEFRRNLLLDDFNQHLACPSSFVESEPTDEEIRVTTGWRVDYLRRLRREGTDESYIEAYKKAWNLSEDDLKEAAE